MRARHVKHRLSKTCFSRVWPIFFSFSALYEGRGPMLPIFCPVLTTILLHFPLSASNSLHSPTTPTLLISLRTQLSHLNHDLPLFLLPILPQPIHSLPFSLPLSAQFPAHLSWPASFAVLSISSAHQSPPSAHPSASFPPSSLPQSS